MIDDIALLRRFVQEGSEGAFRELVRQRIDFVYGTALRQVGGDAHVAEEVAQAVFVDLAQKARALTGRSNLAGWLHTSTRFASAKARRSRVRRLLHETEALTMHEILGAPERVPSTETDWQELRPVIDTALHELNEADREAILLRYFDGRSLAEVGAAIGLAENSARMRVERALEKLRARLATRGITSTAVALGTALASQPVMAAPAGLAVTAAGSALAGVAMGGGALLPVAKFMSRTKIALGLAGLAAVVGTGAYIGGLQRTEMQEAELAALRSQNQTLAANVQRAQAARTAVRPQVSTGESGNLNGAQRLKDVAVGVAARRAQREATAALSGGKGAAAPTGPIAPASAETLRALAELTKRNLVNVDMTFVSPSGKLDPAFAELFGLTAGERIALQQSVDHARERLAEAEQANATVTRDAQGNVVVAVKAFAEAGGAAYDEMMKTFAGTLGTERYAAFNALGASRVESALGSFGAVDRTVTFSMDPGRPEGRRYEVRDNHKMAGTSGTSTAGFSTMQGALNWVGTVGRLVPADFGK